MDSTKIFTHASVPYLHLLHCVPRESLGDEGFKTGGPLNGKQQEFHVNLHRSLAHDARQLPPGDFTELHANSLADVPRRWEYVAKLFLKVHKRAFDPGITTVNFVQPRHLAEEEQEGDKWL